MHCPRCGQLQVSDQTKFCSRCGFQLALVGELLQNGGYLPQLGELHKGKTPWFSRKNGLIFSALWFIVFVMMLPAFAGIAGEKEAAGVFAVFGVFSTMIFVIISLAFLKTGPKILDPTMQQMAPVTPPTLYGNPQMGALPPQQAQPAASYMAPEGNWRAPDTGDLVRPGSVTEGTTRLLKKDEN